MQIGDVYHGISETRTAEDIWLAKKIEEFLTSKHESPLWQTFGLVEMLEYNLRRAAAQLRGEARVGEAAELNEFFTGGGSVLNIRYGTMTRQNNTMQVKGNPGEMCMLNLSLKRETAMDRLAALTQSLLLHGDVKDHMERLNKATLEDRTLMLDRIDALMKDNPSFILNNSDRQNGRCGAASGDYWKRFIHLRPVVYDIAAAMRVQLKT